MEGLGSVVGQTFESISLDMIDAMFNSLMQSIYFLIYSAAAEFFTMINNMGADIYELSWVQATIDLFSILSWALFIIGVIVAVFDLAIEYQNGRANIKTTAINTLKGFFACSLIGILPVELYKFAISLQNTFSIDLVAVFASSQNVDISGLATDAFASAFELSGEVLSMNFLNFVSMIVFIYCIVKIFFANIKRGGILLVQIAVGTLYMFSIPRGYQDGFNQWIKQVIALCLTSFMQTTLLLLGLITFRDDMLLGLGILLAANEVPRIAGQFGLDSSVKVNMTSVMHTTSSAVSLTKSVATALR